MNLQLLLLFFSFVSFKARRAHCTEYRQHAFSVRSRPSKVKTAWRNIQFYFAIASSSRKQQHLFMELSLNFETISCMISFVLICYQRKQITRSGLCSSFMEKKSFTLELQHGTCDASVRTPLRVSNSPFWWKHVRLVRSKWAAWEFEVVVFVKLKAGVSETVLCCHWENRIRRIWDSNTF